METASLREAPGARLKLIVTDGNWSWCWIVSGAVLRSILATALSGTCAPLVEGTNTRDKRGRVALVLLHGLQHDAVLVGLGIDGRDLALAEGVVERVVDGLHGDAEAACGLPVDLDEGAQAAVLGLGDGVAQHGRHAQLFNQAGGPQRDFLRTAADQRVLVLRAALAGADLDVLHRLEEHDHARHGRYRALQAVDDGGDICACAPRAVSA